MKRDSLTMHALKADLKALKEADFVTSMNRLSEKEAARFLNLASLKTMPTKPKAPISFRIKRSPRTKQFRCVVSGGNHEPTLVGEPCKNRRDVLDTIFSHIDAILGGSYIVADDEGEIWIARRKVPAPKTIAKKPRLDRSKLNRNWP